MKTGVAIVIAGLAMVVAGCGSSNSSSNSTTSSTTKAGGQAATSSMSLELDYVPNPDDMGLYYALSKGYFSSEGLNVQPHSPANIDTPLRLVATGTVDVAFSYEPEVYSARAERLPVVAVGSVIPVPLTCIASKGDSGLTTAASLKGKTIAVDGTQTDTAILSGVLRYANLGLSDVTTENASANGVQDVLAGRVDADAAAFINYDAVEIEEADGKKPNCINITQSGVPTFDEIVVVANSERLKSDSGYAAIVRKFLKGLIAGTKGALADRPGATAAMAKVAGLKPGFLSKSMAATFNVLTPPSGRPIGCLSPTQWNTYGEWGQRNKLISKLPPASSVMSTAYVPGPC
jgi:putative hydroxymethylpyrimidine transport system substrate-binding protein